MTLVSAAVVLVVLAAALVLAIGFAFLPMRLLLTHMAANIEQFILRQRDRRGTERQAPERRKQSGNPVV